MRNVHPTRWRKVGSGCLWCLMAAPMQPVACSALCEMMTFLPMIGDTSGQISTNIGAPSVSSAQSPWSAGLLRVVAISRRLDQPRAGIEVVVFSHCRHAREHRYCAGSCWPS